MMGDLRVLVFGPGENSQGFELREAVRKAIEKAGAHPSYAENILEGSEMNAVLAEKILIGQVDLVFILLAGLGQSVEFGTYIQKEAMAMKFNIFQEKKYVGKSSFLNEVMKLFCGRFRQCFPFESESELEGLVADVLKYHALWRAVHH